MFRREAIFMLVSFLSLIVLSLLATTIAPKLFRWASLCANTIVDQQLSPDNARKVVVFVRDCGATTGFNAQISVLQTSQDLQDDGGNLFIADTNGRTEAAHWGGPKVDIHWVNDVSIAISFDHNARVFKQQENLLGIKVIYKQY